MLISIDQRLVTAASLVWETFSDQDAQDHYWNLTLSTTARITEVAISLRMMMHFLLSLQAWLHRFDYEEIEQYQTALPEAPTPKLLNAAPVALADPNPWDGQAEPQQATAVAVVRVSQVAVSSQLLLAPAQQNSATKQKSKRAQPKTRAKSRNKTKNKAMSAISLHG